MTKQWRIKQEFLSADGCFARGGGIEQGSEFDSANQAPEISPIEAGVMRGAEQAQTALQPQATLPQGMAAPADIGAPIMPQSAQQSAPQPAAVPGGPTGTALSIAGYQNEANAQSGIAREQAGIQGQAVSRMDQMAADYQTGLQQHMSDVDQVVNDMKASKIDPEHYVNSKSPVGKISTAIGLILGGIGGGLMGTENPALKFLNQQIENDVNAQKENAKGKENLLTALEKRYGNQTDAMKMANAIYTQKMAAQINEAALKSGDKMAQARAQQVIGQLQQQAQGSVQGVAAEQAFNKALSSGQDVTELSPYMDEKQRDRAVPGHGLALTKEAAKKMNEEIIPAYKGAMQGVSELKSFSQLGSRANLQDRQLAEAAQTRVIGQLRLMLLGPGTISDSERALVKNLVANPTNLFSIANGPKLEALQNALQKDYEARSKQAGVKTPQRQQAAAPQNFGFTPRK